MLLSKDASLKYLKPDSVSLSNKAKWLHAIIKRDLASDSAWLKTSLTCTFLERGIF